MFYLSMSATRIHRVALAWLNREPLLKGDDEKNVVVSLTLVDENRSVTSLALHLPRSPYAERLATELQAVTDRVNAEFADDPRPWDAKR